LKTAELAAFLANLLHDGEKRRKLRSFQTIKETELPAQLTAELRDYQVEGYNWLNFLDEFQWGGILADDMGLGKTVQILAFLQKQINDRDRVNLVVVPTSLLFNWENEIEKFTPQIRYKIHHGIDRTTDFRELLDYDLIITTYGLAANDLELFNRIRFNYIVLDESQAIKNPSSKRYKAVCLLRGRNKLAMTGTPIENNTFDLYAQLNFLNPGFLGSQQGFKENFSKPIDGEGDRERAAELQRLIKPFVLRRTKEQVASELPPKVEDYLYCTMEAGQRQVYDAYRNRYRDYLMSKIEEEGLQRSKLFVLEGLLKLRQICDSPELLNDEEDYGKESIKIKELMSQITEKTGRHKILVFSQFVKMLQIIRRRLEQQGLSYEYLDGQTTPRARERAVNHFQEDESCRVFLISLKAGGTGLNLTAADYVYLVDPWWNPAVESQAIDRTHRIGQNKHIIAYRMICKGTVEEKILNYQKKKLKIASDIIHTDESFMKSLTKEDISELFQ
ncbi:MAG: DEAD/DEAH box helicase, partial [Bacteroidota bacterium]